MADEFAQDLTVTAEWLRAHLDDPKVRVIDARPAAKYEQGHIPGAASIDVYALPSRETTPTAVQDFIALMTEAFAAAGVADDQTVVFYQENAGEWAARGLWCLYFLGHDGGRLLDGGMDAWQAAGGAVSTEASKVKRTTFKVNPRMEEFATYQDVQAAIDDPRIDIVDTRRGAEYMGTEIRSPRGGRVPGAIHLEWVANLTDEGRLKSARDLTDQYAELGLTPGREVITYCQGGYRAAHTWLVLKMLGYPKVSNYAGSWFEWGRREGLPIENLTLPEPKSS